MILVIPNYAINLSFGNVYLYVNSHFLTNSVLFEMKHTIENKNAEEVKSLALSNETKKKFVISSFAILMINIIFSIKTFLFTRLMINLRGRSSIDLIVRYTFLGVDILFMYFPSIIFLMLYIKISINLYKVYKEYQIKYIYSTKRIYFQRV
jgi:hypothetical protein